MSLDEVSKLLWAACRAAGVDPHVVFAHYGEADLRAYAAALRDGAVKAADLPRWMASTRATIADGRCLCRACSADTGRAAA